MSTFKFIRPNSILDAAGTFTRSTTATYFDSAGVLQTAGINVPRIGYDPVTHAHTGLMLEAAATNLLTYSAQFNTGGWVPGITTVTANTTVAPDGTTTADTVTDDGAGSYEVLAHALVPAVLNQSFCFSIFVKKDTTGRAVRFPMFRLVFYDPGFQYIDFSIDTATGATSSYSVGAAAINASGVIDAGGYWRVWVSARGTSVSTSSVEVDVYPAVGASAGWTYSATTTGSIIIWGAQLELGTAPTSYIPTAGSTVTRGADTPTGSGMLYTDVPETDYPAWVGGTTYTALTSFVIRTTATTHKIYQCLVTHTTAATPEDNVTGVTPKWLEVGPTNRWAMFDQRVGTVTTVATSMTYLLKPGRANSISLLGIDATTVEVSLAVSGETVYSASLNLVSGDAVGGWYQYFYEPIYQTDSVSVTNLLDTTLFDLPQYADGVLCVRFLRTGGNVTCGVLVAGVSAELGITQYNPTVGIIDYSRKSTDDFGNTTVVARTYSKRMSCTLDVARGAVDNIARLLAQYRATPVVWVAADNLFTSLIVYGFYKDWEVTLEGYDLQTCSIQIEGLT